MTTQYLEVKFYIQVDKDNLLDTKEIFSAIEKHCAVKIEESTEEDTSLNEDGRHIKCFAFGFRRPKIPMGIVSHKGVN
jgi:hypothetical protein